MTKQESLQYYLQKFKKLRIDRSHGLAPHKPILLISILQGVHLNIIPTNKVFITPELGALFTTNWNALVITNHDCRISYPFYYMKSDTFWHLIPRTGFDNLESLGSIVKSFSKLNAAVEFAWMDEDLFFLMENPNTNYLLLKFLLDEYFPVTKNNFKYSSSDSEEMLHKIEDKILHENPAEYKVETTQLILEKNEEEIFLRGSLFKREIPKIYNNTCCISGMKINSVLNVSMIDACHIVPFSNSYDDTITNGIALCPNLHRAFDRGLISLDDQYRVMVSTNFQEETSPYSIKYFDGKTINLPFLNNYYPSLDNLEWHRRNVFR